MPGIRFWRCIIDQENKNISLYIYRQVNGFSIGVSLGGSAAHIFLYELFAPVLFVPKIPLNFWYIDDGIGTYDGSEEAAEVHLQSLNWLDDNIKATVNIGSFSVVHLDVIYFRGPGLAK